MQFFSRTTFPLSAFFSFIFDAKILYFFSLPNAFAAEYLQKTQQRINMLQLNKWLQLIFLQYSMENSFVAHRCQCILCYLFCHQHVSDLHFSMQTKTEENEEKTKQRRLLFDGKKNELRKQEAVVMS